LSADAAQIPPSPPQPPQQPPPQQELDYANDRRRRRLTGPTESLSGKAARGFVWLMLQTVASKLVSFGSEIVLALWLLKSDFGVRSDAMTVLAFVALLQDYGINQVLIHRQHRFALWANSAFWASIAIGVAGGVVLALIAPLVALAYGTPALTGMILILALRSPLNAIGTVSYAKLQIDLRYRTLAVIGFLAICVTAITSIVCAKLGLGAYSFMWPLLIAAAFRSALLWQAAPPPVKPRLQMRRWRYLGGQSGLLLAASALFMLTSQGDYMTLGAIYRTDAGRAAVVAVYFFGFFLCVQTTQFITTNLANVLLPTFSKLQHEPQRLRRAFIRASRMLAITGVFICLLQAAVATPMIRTLFRPKGDPDKWIPAVPILKIISLAMAFQLFNMPALSLIQAQGRFRTMLKLAIAFPLLFFSMVWLAASTGEGQLGQIRYQTLNHFLERLFHQPVNVSAVVALAVAGYCAVIGPACLYVAIRPVGGSWRDIWPIYVWPVLTSLAAIVAGMAIGRWLLPRSHGGDWGRLLLVPVISGLLYLPLVRLTARDAWDDAVQRISGLVRRQRA
jgi:O-antigen/teichoic acid export membrane protein